MPLINPDLTEMQDLAPIPNGTYPAKVTEVNLKMSKGGEGKRPVQMIVPKFEVTVDGKNRTRQTYLPVEGAGTFGFDQILRACHFDKLADQYKDPTQTNPDFDTDQLIGQEMLVVVEEELYQPRDGSGNPVGEARRQDRIRTYLKK